MQRRLEDAERSGVAQATERGEEHLHLVVDAKAVDSGTCSSALRVAGLVLDCAHVPSAAPAWTSAAANVTVLARECEGNGTAQVVASETLAPPADVLATVECAKVGGVVAGKNLNRFAPQKKVCEKSMHCAAKSPCICAVKVYALRGDRCMHCAGTGACTVR